MMDTAYCENDLINRLASGDADAFTTVYRQHYQRVYYYAKTFLPDKHDAEDITADTFIKLWNRRDSFKSISGINSFLHITARNSCYDFLRHNKVVAEKQADIIRQIELHSGSELFRTKEELIRLVEKEVDKLSARMKQIFYLSFNEGLTPAQIAETLKVSVQTVSNQKTTLLKILKRELSHNASPLITVAVLESLRHFLR
jgi:RNA polymerase sigma-70 factor (ECF subfamily)